MRPRSSGDIDFGGRRTYDMVGDATSTNKEQLIELINKQIDEFRGEWGVKEIHIHFEKDPDMPNNWRADFMATLEPK